MATNKWSAAGASNWSTAGNWSLGHKPAAGEDVVLDATSVFGCTLDEGSAISLASFTIANAYTGTFTMNAGRYIYSTGSVYFGTGCAVVADATSGVYWSGAAAVSLTTSGQTLGAVTHSGTGILTLQDALTASAAVYVGGPLAQNGKAMVCGGAFSSYKAASTYDAAVTVAGGVTFAIAAPVSAPTTLTMTATGTLTTMAGQVLNAVVVTGGTVTLGANLSCTSVNVSGACTFNSANKAITVTTGWYDNATTVNLGSSVLTLAGGATYLAILSVTRTTSGATIQHTGAANVIINIGTYTTTISRLILKAGQSYLFTASNNIATVSNRSPGDWDNMVWASTLLGGAWHVNAPAGAVTGLNVTDCHNVGAVIDASDGTCIDGGGNTGFLWPSPPLPPTGDGKALYARKLYEVG
jgi:hypothetical protein